MPSKVNRSHQVDTEILQYIVEGIYLVRANDGVIVYTNPVFDSMFGYAHGDVLGQHFATVSNTIDRSSRNVAIDINYDLDNQGWWRGELSFVKNNKSNILCNVSISMFTHSHYGKVWISIIENINRKKQVEDVLEKSKKKYRDLFEKSQDAILFIENYKFVNCNQATLDMLGYREKQELLQTHPSQLSPEFQADGQRSDVKADEMINNALEQGSNRYEWNHLRANGEVFPVEVLLTTINNEPHSQVIHAVWRDITLKQQQQQRIQYQAHFDALTDLPNRFLALDRLEKIMQEAKRSDSKAAVLFLDLDDFKKINDTLGHDSGDRILVQTAERLRKAVRSVDTVARLGGDEFIILLGGLNDIADAGHIAIKLLDCFNELFHIDNREVILSTSIGISCFPGDGVTTSELLRKADKAMYHTKEQGRNSYHYFTESMNSGIARRLILEEQLHNALAQDEFHLCYQPLIDIQNNSIVGAEALLRWDNPTLGSVSPVEFIPIAEQTGHIVQIGRYVLTEALAMAGQWQKKHLKPFNIAINLSPRQFRDVDLLQHIENTLQQEGIKGDSLKLEITEGVMMSKHATIEDTLNALTDLGVSLAIDDFGTGYSSMTYLRRYPFDTLKIDRSFVSGVCEDEADRELVNATIAMAHGLKLKVVAEGVETQEQLDYLAQQQCEYAQGYLFSKPVTADEFGLLLEKGLN
ncbi:MAG: diguanylate cyclase (GGDEF)-like protein/PAS domain S-box-containing protein [Pseudohongiellaceae bacterium]|jgi:diguanylate cyclase (GGDEF)-like protein/PAS domain S-box-containing protein